MSESRLLSLFDEETFDDEILEISLTDIAVSDYIEPSDEFIASVRRFGVIDQPLLCMKSRNSKKYAVLSGRRRILAARACGYTHLLCKVRKGFVYDSAKASMLTLEAQRQFNPNPIAEFKAVMTLIKGGYSKDEIKEALGITEEQFTKLTILSVLPEDVLEAVKTRKVALGTALSLAKMNEIPRKEAVQRFRANEALSGSDLKEIRQAKTGAVFQNVMGEIAKAQPAEERGSTVRERVAGLLRPEKSVTDTAWNQAINKVLEII